MQKRSACIIVSVLFLISVLLYGCEKQQEFAGEAFLKLDALKKTALRDCLDESCSDLSTQSPDYRKCAKSCMERARLQKPVVETPEPQQELEAPEPELGLSASPEQDTAEDTIETMPADDTTKEPADCGIINWEIDEAAAQEVLDCLDSHLENCEPAKIQNTLLGDAHIEIIGLSEGKCIIRSIYSDYFLYPPLSGKSMECSLDTAGLTFERYTDMLDEQLFDICTGDFIDGLNEFICSRLKCSGDCEKGKCINLVNQETSEGCCLGIVGCSRAYSDSECSPIATFKQQKCEDLSQCDVVACCHDVPGIPRATYRNTCEGITGDFDIVFIKEFMANPSTYSGIAEQMCVPEEEAEPEEPEAETTRSAPAVTSSERICDDGIDDDRDGAPDCFDADCSDECSVYFGTMPVCCLDHDERTCNFYSTYNRENCGTKAKYPVISEETCRSGCQKFSYTYLS